MRPADYECLDPGFVPGLHRPSRLHFSLPLDAARLLRARHRIRDYLHDHEITPRVIDDAILAIQEAMTNAVLHSEADDDLEVTLGFVGSDLILAVRDHGRGFAVDTFDPEELPDLDSSHGRGLFLISRLMDELELTNDGGLEVRAVKRGILSAPPSDAGATPSPAVRAHRDARRESVLEEIDEAFFALDWEYRFGHVNSSYERMFERRRDEILGRTVVEAFPAFSRSDAMVALQEAMELGHPATLEYLSPAAQRWLELRVYRPCPASRPTCGTSTAASAPSSSVTRCTGAPSCWRARRLGCSRPPIHSPSSTNCAAT